MTPKALPQPPPSPPPPSLPRTLGEWVPVPAWLAGDGQWQVPWPGKDGGQSGRAVAEDAMLHTVVSVALTFSISQEAASLCWVISPSSCCFLLFQIIIIWKKEKKKKKRKKPCECQCENATVITSNTQCLMFCSILGMPSEGLGKMRRSSRCPWETDVKTLCWVPAGSLSVHGPHRAAGGAVGWVPQYTRGHVDRQSLVMQIRHDTWFGTSAVRLGSSCSEGGAWLPPAVYCEGGLSSLIYTVVRDTVYSVEWGADSKRGREDGLSLRRWTHHLSTPFRVSVESVWANDREKLCESCSPVCLCVMWESSIGVENLMCILLVFTYVLYYYHYHYDFVLAHFKIFFDFFVCFTRTSAPAFCNTMCKVLHMDACQHPLNFLSLRLWWVLFPCKIGTVDSWKRVYIQVLVPVIFVFLSGSAGIVQSCLAKWVSKQVTYAAKVVELVLHERGGERRENCQSLSFQFVWTVDLIVAVQCWLVWSGGCVVCFQWAFRSPSIMCSLFGKSVDIFPNHFPILRSVFDRQSCFSFRTPRSIQEIILMTFSLFCTFLLVVVDNFFIS